MSVRNKPESGSLDRRQLLGTLSGFFAFLIWGLLPFYWKWLGSVTAAEILAHRIVWSAIMLVVLVPLIQREELKAALRDRAALLIAGGAGLIVGANWFVYTWAVGAERLVEASLGYYINPLVSVVLGILVLRERLSRMQLVAVGLATVGVLVLTISHGRLPWISLALASSFGLYGLVKKIGRLNSLISLLVELIVLFPIAAVFLAIRHADGAGSFAAGTPRVSWLLAGAGVVTIAPLLLFGGAARRIPLSRVGLLQYLAPTLMLVIGTLFYGEPFTAAHAVSFAFIWSALGVYSATLVRRSKRPAGAVGVTPEAEAVGGRPPVGRSPDDAASPRRD
ncbi:MAG: EamA family transporter RarD [Spirochaetota bacterium]